MYNRRKKKNEPLPHPEKNCLDSTLCAYTYLQTIHARQPPSSCGYNNNISVTYCRQKKKINSFNRTNII